MNRLKKFLSNKKTLKVILISCLCVFICSLAYLGYILVVHLNQRKIESEINNLFDEARQVDEIAAPTPAPPEDIVVSDNEPAEPEPEESEWERERRLLLEAEARGRLIYADILEINGDFLGMIEIPGVIERQPYVMSHDNDEYLSRDFNGNKSVTGTVFLSMLNDRLMMDNNSALFGHYTDTGSMFAKLLSYKNAATFANSPVIKLDGLIGESTWIIFSAFVVEPEVWWMIPYNNKDDYAAHLDELRARSLFITDVDVTPDDRIITLAVCDYTYEDMRFVVHARKLRPGEDAPESVIAEPNPDRKGYTIPHLNSTSDIDMTGAAFSASASGGRYFYYVPRAGYIERYVGDSRNVQGPFAAVTHSGISPESHMSALIVGSQEGSASRSVYLAVQGADDGQGISLFTATYTNGTFRHDGLLTPEGVDARYPAIQRTGGKLWLLYSVPGDNGSSAIYRQNILGGSTEHLYSVAGVSNARPLGAYSVSGQTFVVWYEPGNGGINGAYTGTGEVTNLHNTLAGARVMFYGDLSEGAVKCAVESGGTVGFETISLGITPDSGMPDTGEGAENEETEDTGETEEATE